MLYEFTSAVPVEHETLNSVRDDDNGRQMLEGQMLRLKYSFRLITIFTSIKAALKQRPQ